MPFQNNLLVDTLLKNPTVRSPVWLMRQAGRILPEYRAIRKKFKNFVDLLHQPSLAATITIQPVDRLSVDAAILFSDILVVVEAMGVKYEIIEKKGPLLSQTITTQRDIKNLHIAIPQESMGYVLESIDITKKALNNRVPLIGFAAAPWTILCYMVEGGSSKKFEKTRKFIYQAPHLAHQLLHKITQSTIAYLQAQIEAGIDVVQIFDSWAGLLPPSHYKTFSIDYIAQICTSIKVPKIVFSKGAHFSLSDLVQLQTTAIGIDWQTDISVAKQYGKDKVLQGNLDPAALYGNKKQITQQTTQMLDAFGKHPHIVNLGHGVYPDTPVENVKHFIETVKEYSEIKDLIA